MRASIRALPFIVLLLLLGVPALGQPTPAVPSLSADQVARLNRGEILVEVVNGEVPVGEALGVIDAPPELVMTIVGDYWDHSRIFDDIVLSEVIGRDGEFVLQHGITDTPWPMSDREYTLRAWHGTREIDGMELLVSTWDYVEGSGNIDDTEGYYLLIPWGEDGSQTLLRYTMSVDLGSWLPDFLLNWGTADLLPGRIEGIRNALVPNLPGT